jgi:predicted nucleic acid-binding protein
VNPSPINYITDTGPLVALFDGSDEWNDWSSRAFIVLNEPIYTTEAIITETAHLLRRHRPAVLNLTRIIADGRLRILPVLDTAADRIAQLLEKYPQMDFGDATLVALSEEFPRARLITIDRADFSFYRRKDGTAVPSIMPSPTA